MATYNKPFIRYYKDKDSRSKANAPLPLSLSIQKVFQLKGETEFQKKLSLLWEHWNFTLGDYLSSLAYPLGHRGKILLIAGEDNIALNELTYASEEILERVHAFLDEEYFEKVELHLLFGKRPLNEPVQLHEAPQKLKLIKPENLGHLLETMPEGKVKEAYKHYLSLFKNE